MKPKYLALLTTSLCIAGSVSAVVISQGNWESESLVINDEYSVVNSNPFARNIPLDSPVIQVSDSTLTIPKQLPYPIYLCTHFSGDTYVCE